MKNRDAVGDPVLNEMVTNTITDFIENLDFRRTDKMLRNFLIAYLKHNNGETDIWFDNGIEDLFWIFDLLDTLEAQYFDYDLEGKGSKEKDKKIAELDKEIKKHGELSRDLLDQLKEASERDKKYLNLQIEYAQLQVKHSSLLADIQMQKAKEHQKTVDEHVKQVDEHIKTPKRS